MSQIPERLIPEHLPWAVRHRSLILKIMIIAIISLVLYILLGMISEYARDSQSSLEGSNTFRTLRGD